MYKCTVQEGHVMHYGDFRRVVYRDPADRELSAPENRLRSGLLLLLMVLFLIVIVSLGLRPIMGW